MKIGIITAYYKNANYGGSLQAYALQCYLNKTGYDTEQICYDVLNLERLTWARFLKYSATKKCKVLARGSINNIKTLYNLIICKQAMQYQSERERAIFRFNSERVPHSARVYDIVNISEAAQQYDVFVTGSDQVWNVDWLNPPFFLNFVSDNKLRISYAASLGKKHLTEEQLSIFKHYLEGFFAVSVREEESVGLIENVSPVPVKWVLDPTMLLSREEWDEVCAERQINVPYVFCYFLGDDSNERKIAQEFARKRNLKLVTLPYLVLNNRVADKGFGDIQVSNISPDQLLSLIKHAEYVFTDSFHATVFSGLFQKQYFVFGRSGFPAMGSRIDSLTKIYDSEERFCNNAERASIEYISTLEDIDYTRELPMFKAMKQQSEEFLRSCMKQAKERLQVE